VAAFDADFKYKRNPLSIVGIEHNIVQARITSKSFFPKTICEKNGCYPQSLRRF
jgi:hypothetical protein